MEEYQAPMVKVNDKDPNFLQWFLNNREGIANLKYMWRGYDRDEKGMWFKPDDYKDRRLMNEKGIHWATQVMESYLDRVFQATNWDSENMNYQMRKAARVIWLGLKTQYREFEMEKINYQTVGHQMFARIHAILLSARGEGIRNFIGKTQQVSEIIQNNPDQQRGFFSGVSGLFGRRQ
jgi:hypothetical protein